MQGLQSFFRIEAHLIVNLFELQTLNGVFLTHHPGQNVFNRFADIVVCNFPKDNIKTVTIANVGTALDDQFQPI